MILLFSAFVFMFVVLGFLLLALVLFPRSLTSAGVGAEGALAGHPRQNRLRTGWGDTEVVRSVMG